MSYNWEREVRQSVERQNKNLQELLGMMKENPELPVLPMVDSEIVADDGYNWWTAAWGYPHIGRICIANERVVEYEQDDVWSAFEDCGFDYDECGITEEMDDNEAEQVAREYLAGLDWLDAILVSITTPDDTLPDNTEKVRQAMKEE